MQNPPDYCQNKATDKAGTAWAETLHCAHCKDPECSAYKLLLDGEKTRLKLMNTDKPPLACPHCECAVQGISDDLVVTTYVCGTTNDRISGSIQYQCKKPVQPVRRATRIAQPEAAKPTINRRRR